MTRPDDLTPSQREAVEHAEGPLLVLAGPGSGKTRVITRRVARMVERGIDARQILAITFTNKAADELQQRVSALLPGCRVWVSTFHKFCARILRGRAEVVGLSSNFSIYDTLDQRQLIKQILGELQIDTARYRPSKIASQISRAKNNLQSAEDFTRMYEDRIGHHQQAVVAKVYPLYQRALLDSNAVDFDDLLLHMVELLCENPELRRDLDERFRYVLVDEYQDTNLAQYQIVKALSHDFQNLCVTGDPDQSIYRWRGAQIGNILRFETDFPDATIVRLEQNFRSSLRIVEAAGSLISHNVHRKIKSLVTDNPPGRPVELRRYAGAVQEAEAIATEIRQSVDSGEGRWSDFAVCYRVNALSRQIETALGRRRIPFQVASGLAFYARAEVKDMLAYLKLINNPDDRTALRRVINTPTRGIGKKTLAKLFGWASREGLSPLQGAANAERHPDLSRRAINALKGFAAMIDEFSAMAGGSVEELLRTVIEHTEYTYAWKEDPTEQDRQRLANVGELVTAAVQYEHVFEEEASLEGFLESTSLVNETDSIDDTTGQVTLMTLHAAKGLEYPVVFIVGVEHNLIPHERSLNSDDLHELEEERRLLFVGMTRAMRRLVLTMTVKREFQGRVLTSVPSMFLREIPLTLVDEVGDGNEFNQRNEFDQRLPEPTEPADAVKAIFAIAEKVDPIDHPLLMTGADLLNGVNNAAEFPRDVSVAKDLSAAQEFSVGMTVRHPSYGLGRVRKVGGISNRRTVTVTFEVDDRNETFIASKCPLQPVGLDGLS